jgi:hypothetical protein
MRNVQIAVYILYCGLFVVALMLRTLHMHESTHVTWDEAQSVILFLSSFLVAVSDLAQLRSSNWLLAGTEILF